MAVAMGLPAPAGMADAGRGVKVKMKRPPDHMDWAGVWGGDVDVRLAELLAEAFPAERAMLFPDERPV